MSIVDQLRKDGSLGGCQPPCDDALAKSCPLLWDLLTIDRYKKGEVRFLPDVKVRRVSGAYEIVLQDHETCQQIAALSLTWDGLALALEAALGAGLVPWRPFRSYVNPKGLKRHDGRRA